ncbi:MAG: thioredoxin-like domain-containing protein [Fermentimonas sp.]|jgi:glutathione peroxidase-family protein
MSQGFKKILVTLSAVAVMAVAVMNSSCKRGNVFRVEGQLEAAKGDTLYLEQRGLAGIVKLDSVVLKANGHFVMEQPAPPNPEFYQLRIGQQVTLFVVDSTETLRVTANGDDLYHSFKVADSPANDRLRWVDERTMQVADAIEALKARYEAKELGDEAFVEQFEALIQEYKEEASKVIIGNPSSAAAYYAVFQKIGDYLVFDPYDKRDYAMFGAVATSWNYYYPETERTKHLYDFAMNALRTRKQREQQSTLLENIPVIEAPGLLDIELKGVSGKRISLSSLKGKAVLLDFVVYNAEFSPGHNMRLNTLYERYKGKGLEIYQVSFDPDEHFWKTSAANLPWITVRDPGAMNAALLSTYNVSVIPTAFVINREGEIVKRVEDYEQLAAAIEKVL